MTSSRQSPRMSPDSDGVALVLLLECTPLAVSSRVSDEVPYLSMLVASSSSRTGSASHQTRKFAERACGRAEAPDGAAQAGVRGRPGLGPGAAGVDVPGDPRPLSTGGRRPDDLRRFRRRA